MMCVKIVGGVFMKKIVKTVDGILAILCCILFILISFGSVYAPEEITFYDGTNEVELLHIFTISKTDEDIMTASTAGAPSGKADVSLFGFVPVSQVNAQSEKRKTVTVGGDVIGIRLYTEGLLVVGLDDVATADGNGSPGRDCGICEGDVITQANGKSVTSASEFAKIIAGSEGKEVKLTIRRNGETIPLTLTPVYSEAEGKYRCGVWLRDSTAGIGTLTFVDDETGMFASLGHAICDSDTGSVLPVGNGDILTATVTGCTPGEKGKTGQIKGTFTQNVIGKLMENNEFGVYGTVSETSAVSGEKYAVASQAEIKTGDAQIITTVGNDGPQFYDIEIEKITYSSEKASRSMVIEITDPELLAVTGGIVQGMSGSPIIQDGMLVGAVTHVFLNDPTRGYAVFAETMVSEAERIFMNAE